MAPGDPEAPAGAGLLAVAREALAVLAASARPAGGATEAAARTWCAARLTDVGFTVHEAPFEYSALPGRWATPVAGLAWIATIAAAGHLGAHGRPRAALACLVGAALVVVAGARWAARRGVLAVPFGRRRGVNLVGRRAPRDPPAVWLVAHLDSKSQPVPMLARVLGITIVVGCWGAAIAVAAAQTGGWAPGGWWVGVTLLGVLAGLPVAASVVGAASPGAVDNASGVAAVLLAARRLAPSLPVGVLLTSAEELGLAGARAWLAATPPARDAVILNCDGVDDRGYLSVMYSHRRPTRAVDAFPGARARRVLPGILVDAVAFADAGWDAVTVCRGTVGTLARIHSARDTADRLDGTGIVEAATALAGATERLTARVHRRR